MEYKKQTVYVVTRALTHGILEREWHLCDMYIRLFPNELQTSYRFGKDFFLTKDEALLAAEKMRLDAIAKANKQIANLQAKIKKLANLKIKMFESDGKNL